MVIMKRGEGATSVYEVCADVRETCEKHPREIATFNTLANAVLVLKYMRGDRLSQTDVDRAKEIIDSVL